MTLASDYHIELNALLEGNARVPLDGLAALEEGDRFVVPGLVAHGVEDVVELGEVFEVVGIVDG